MLFFGYHLFVELPFAEVVMEDAAVVVEEYEEGYVVDFEFLHEGCIPAFALAVEVEADEVEIGEAPGEA